MYAGVVKLRACFLVMTIVALVLASCGGGTTGTSSVDSVKFAGYAEQADGSRAPFLSMTVLSGASGQDLRDSGTNADGDFAMALPASESSLVVDIAGVGITTMQRQQQGAGTLSAKLLATAQGLQSGLQFEAQVSTANLCTNLSVSGDELVVIGDEDIVPCLTTFSLASRELPLEDFQGSVISKCGNAFTTLSSAEADIDGHITLDLSAALAGECTDTRIEISHPQAPGLQSTFYVK